MAAIANTFQTVSSVGNREELADIISNISPEDTPYLTGAGGGKIKSTFPEWQQDELADAVDDNAHVEGDDIDTFEAVEPTRRIGNYAQIARKTLILSDTQEVVDKAGRKSELAYQVAKKGAELKRDQEKGLLANKAGNAGSKTTARVAAGLPAWLFSNTNFDTTDATTPGADPDYSASPYPNVARTDSLTQRAFTEDMLTATQQAVWTKGGQPRVLMVGPYNKTVVSTFKGIAATTWNMNGAKAATVIGTVDVYVGDFGKVSVVPNRFQRERDAFLVDFDYVKVPYLRPYRIKKLAKTGDAEKRLLICEYTHKLMNEGALGGIYDLTTSAA